MSLNSQIQISALFLLTKICVVFHSLSRQCKDSILKYATILSFCVVSSSSFTNHPPRMHNLSNQNCVIK
jgi:hypothetical protein